MIIRWLAARLGQRKAPTLKAIFVATAAGEPMRSIEAAEAIQDRGLQGDRYSEDKGHWKSLDGCQVTLITEHELGQAKIGTQPAFQTALENGSHRRNLVIDGLKTKKLEGRRFRIGSAVFSYEKVRPPCGYLDRVAGQGMCRALSHQSGICIRVVSSGRLSVGDAVEVID